MRITSRQLRQLIKEELARHINEEDERELVFPFEANGFPIESEGTSVDFLKKSCNFTITRIYNEEYKMTGWIEAYNKPGSGTIQWVPDEKGYHKPYRWQHSDPTKSFLFDGPLRTGDKDLIKAPPIVTQGIKDPILDPTVQYDTPANLRVVKGTGDWPNTMWLQFTPR